MPARISKLSTIRGPGLAKYALASTSHGIERCDDGVPIGYDLEIFFLTPLGHFS
jgi:hypothetical protein